jgi:hypothetical protein
MPQLNSNLVSIQTPGEGCLSVQSQPLSLLLTGPRHPRRARAEAFVQAVFMQAYGAQLQTFYPLLVNILFPDGDYAAVAGVRPAGSAGLFSEHYLDQPVERILGVERQRIVEIGNLAPASAGQARWLICTLTAFLGAAGFTHVVFTAVPALKNAFARMGLPLTRHAAASAERLPPEQAMNWGSYYKSRPAVYSGEIRIGVDAFSKASGVDPALRELSAHAADLGRTFATSTGTYRL